MKPKIFLSFMFALCILNCFKIQRTSGNSTKYVRIFLKLYNHYMAMLKRGTLQIQWELEFGKYSKKEKKNAVLIANKASRYMRLIDNKAELLYKHVKGTPGIPKDLMRQLKLINQVAKPKDLKHIMMLNKLLKITTKIYTEARVPMKLKGKTLRLQLNSALIPMMLKVKKGRLNLLKWAWIMWRKVVGKKVRPFFEKMVQLVNKGARDRGYKDFGQFTRSCYDMDGEKFRMKMSKLYAKVEPLYKKLHAYVRFKLRKTIGENMIEEKGMIPAQFLGMWPTHWSHLNAMTVPFPKKKFPNVSKLIKKKGLRKTKLLKLAERFFMSIGFKKLPKSFWKKSIFSKKGNKKMACQASALDLGKGDVRMKMPCISPTEKHLTTIHHEMGHIEYYLSYLKQPFVFRLAANQGFQESIGDTIGLSTTTPKYLTDLNLIQKRRVDKEESINYLAKQALDKVAFLPYSYMIELWRWDVFGNKIPKSKYNTRWWDIRNKLQGIKAPVTRTEKDFDPGAFLHVIKNIEYMPYFFSQILQYMIQKSLCKSAGHKGPLHQCSIFKSKAAGEKLKKLLSMGRSKPWQQVLQETIGANDLDASPLLEYFQPFEDWMDKHRKENGYSIGWNVNAAGKQG